MDTAITDWLSGPSTLLMTEHAGEDLPGVEHWLKDGLPDMVDEDLVSSFVDFTGREFFNDSPPLNDATDNIQAPVPQQSGSSDPTSSADGPTNSGAVCGEKEMGSLNRMGAVRSFSTNDLQLLLEGALSVFAPAAGLSAPHPYGSHIGKAKARPALESVPEGAPSQGGPLPMPASLPVPSGSVPAGCGHSSGATSPALGTSPGTAPFLSRSAPEMAAGAFMPQAAADGALSATSAVTVTPDGGSSCLVASAVGVGAAAGTVFDSQALGPPPQPSQAPAPPVPPAPGLRHVPSTGTLSAMMHSTLQFQREGSDESPQHQQQPELTQPQQLMPQQAHAPGHQGGNLPVAPDVALAAQQHQQQVQAATAAVAAAAAAASGYSLAMPVQHPAALQGLPQACLYGITTQLTTATSLPAGGFPMGLPLPLPTHMLACAPSCSPPQGGGQAHDETGMAATGGAPPGPSMPDGSEGAGAPRLRKCQSALELGAWRTEAAMAESEPFEASGVVAGGQKMIGRLTAEERLQRILRYRNKRNMRNFNREIKYQCRKTLADSRPRVGGRFARNNDPNSVLPHQTKKAMRMKSTGPSSQQQQQQQQALIKVEPMTAGQLAVRSGGVGPMMRNAMIQQQQAQTDGGGPGGQGLQRSSSSARLAGQAFGGNTVGAGARSQGGPASSSTTSTSTNSSEAAAAVTSGNTSAAVVAANMAGGLSAFALPLPHPLPAAFLPAAIGAQANGAEGQQPQQPVPAAVVLATQGGLSYAYALPGLPYHPQALLPGAVVMPHAVPHVAATLPPGLDPAQLQHHYAVVNAAAQAAARGVYAHLGLSDPHAAAAAAAAAASMPLHQQPGLTAHPAMPVGYPYVGTMHVAALPAPAPVAAALGAGAAGIGSPEAGGAPAMQDVPPRLSTPLIEELLTHMDSELGAGALPTAMQHTPAPAEAAPGPSCMAVDC